MEHSYITMEHILITMDTRNVSILKLFVVYLTSYSLCVLWRAGQVNLTTLPQNESVLNRRDSFANMLSGWAGKITQQSAGCSSRGPGSDSLHS